MESEWNKELSKSFKTIENGPPHSPSLIKATIKAFYPGFLSFGVYILLDELFLRIFPPFLMSWLIRYFSSKGHSDITYFQACGYGAGIVLITALSITIQNQYSFISSHIGMRLRVAHSSLIYRKVTV